MIRWALVAAGLSGLAAVAIGAFGAHALGDALGARMRGIFDTGSRYHLVHTLALMAGAMLPAAGLPRRPLAVACGAWLFGIAVFSGSLYLLAVSGLAWLGAITPIGGLAFMVGWGALAVAGWRAR